MKLVRYGQPGKEKPGLIDAAGKLRDLSRVIADITPEHLSDKALAKLAKVNLTSSAAPAIWPAGQAEPLPTSLSDQRLGSICGPLPRATAAILLPAAARVPPGARSTRLMLRTISESATARLSGSEQVRWAEFSPVLPG